MSEGHTSGGGGSSTKTGETSPGQRTTVLVVDDEAGIRESYARVLEPLGYAVREAANASEARRRLDDDVDVALVERQLPDGSGDDLLEEIRSRGLDCRVALVTAVEPDFDILDIDCDDYLVKPVEGDELADTIERMHMLEEYGEKQRELSSLRVKRNVLEVEKDPDELAESAEFDRLERRIETLEADLDELEAEFDDQLGYE